MNWPRIVQGYMERTDEVAAERASTPRAPLSVSYPMRRILYVSARAMVVLAMREFLLGK